VAGVLCGLVAFGIGLLVNLILQAGGVQEQQSGEQRGAAAQRLFPVASRVAGHRRPVRVIGAPLTEDIGARGVWGRWSTTSCIGTRFSP